MFEPRSIPALGAGLALVTLLVVPYAHLQAQDVGFLAGTVLDEISREPLEGALVSVVDTGIEAVSDEYGRFLLEGVPLRAVELKTELDGYVSVVERIEASVTLVTFLRVGLRKVDAVLADLLVIVGRRSPDAEDAEDAGDSWRSALDLIAEDIPGVDVQRWSGSIGGGAAIQIRGTSSFRNNDPAIYLDGIRIDDQSVSATCAAGAERCSSTSQSRRASHVLDLIPAETVARIRVLRGASAAAAYGYSANGVILIETRRGRPRGGAQR